MRKSYSIILCFLMCIPLLQAQQNTTDSGKINNLKTVTVENKAKKDIAHLQPIQGTYIFAGKKNEVIELTQKNIALSEKYGRQIFAKIPGVFVYDMDGTGNQLNIATRGLDPHRSWEFNIRKDGVITNTDMYGYPASHYNIPMEAVERIELVRGTGSLQYGAQFGGMINYVSKQPDSTKTVAIESINTVGSYGLLSTYNGISGKIGKIRYTSWFNKKSVDGYRKNSNSDFNAEAISLFYDASKKLHFKLEWTHSNYVTQLAGPLTDAMFNANPKQATRSRNYYNPNIHIPSFNINWKINPSTELQLTSSAVLGKRNSVLFDKPATTNDAIVSSTLQYNNRQVDIDQFKSFTTELRAIHFYSLFGKKHTLVSGIQWMKNDLHRQQLGKGTTGSDFDLSLVDPVWGRDLHFKTDNTALFFENRIVLSNVLSINAGGRMEIGETDLTGTTTYYLDSELPNTIKHHFPIFGVSMQYDINENSNFYGGISQAYRPVILKDIIPSSVYEVSDKNLKDAFGYNSEFGFRGKQQSFRWDVTGFYLRYNNRLGTIAQTTTNGQLQVVRTNIGNSHNKGIELFIQKDFNIGNQSQLSIFTSTSYIDAHYLNATIRSNNLNINIEGNTVESVPKWISRNGISYKNTLGSLSVLYSYTASSFADALNSISPNATGASGLVPSYQLVDLNVSIPISNSFKIQMNVNNLFDKQYFTKRPQFYPGPGIWPSDGRTISCSISLKY